MARQFSWLLSNASGLLICFPTRLELILPIRIVHAPEIHGQRGAPVQPPSFLARVVVLRPLFAVAHCSESVGADPAAGQVVTNRSRTTLAKREVVLGRADVAGVTLDHEAQRAVGLHRGDGL